MELKKSHKYGWNLAHGGNFYPHPSICAMLSRKAETISAYKTRWLASFAHHHHRRQVFRQRCRKLSKPAESSQLRVNANSNYKLFIIRNSLKLFKRSIHGAAYARIKEHELMNASCFHKGPSFVNISIANRSFASIVVFILGIDKQLTSVLSSNCVIWPNFDCRVTAFCKRVFFLKSHRAPLHAGNKCLTDELFPCIRSAHHEARRQDFALVDVINTIPVKDINAESVNVGPILKARRQLTRNV